MGNQASWPHDLLGVSESDILCKQFLTDKEELILVLRQRYVRP